VSDCLVEEILALRDKSLGQPLNRALEGMRTPNNAGFSDLCPCISVFGLLVGQIKEGSRIEG
jgi:hypothetical protein